METGDDRRDFFKNDYSGKRGQAGYEHDTICGVGSTRENTRLMIRMLHSITDKLKSGAQGVGEDFRLVNSAISSSLSINLKHDK